MKNGLKSNPNYLLTLRGLRQTVNDKGCDINLCFGIAEAVTPTQFQQQKDFADLLVNIVAADRTGRFAATRYGATYNLRRLASTTSDKNKFLRTLQTADQFLGTGLLASALGYCEFHLRDLDGDSNTIIVMGNQFERIASVAKTVADRIKDQKLADIYIIAVGKSDIGNLGKITRSRGRFLRIREFSDLHEIVVDAILSACGY